MFDQTTRRALPAARTLGLLAALGAALAMLALAASAQAAFVHLRDGRTVAYLPSARAAHAAKEESPSAAAAEGKLLYHGGPVMASNENYAFYWSPGGTSAYPAGYLEGIDGYFEGLAAESGQDTNVDSIAAQYTDAEGENAEYDSAFAGAIVDTEPYPANGCHAASKCLTEEQLEAQLEAYVTAHGLPMNLHTGYFILTPPGVESCFEAAGDDCSGGTNMPVYCAWHSYATPAGGTLLFADDPYATGIEGCDDGQHPSESIAEGTLQAGLSRVHLEMTTDPMLNAWFGKLGEVGERCRTGEPAVEFGAPLGTAPDGAPYNQLIDGVEYYYGQEWSNEANACEQRRTWPEPKISALAPRNGPAAGGATVVISGSELRDTTAVYFGSAEAPEVTVVNAGTVEAVTPPGSSGSAEVTLETSHGTSATSARTVYRYGAPTISSVAPAKGPLAGGTSVTVRGSGFAPGATTIEFGAKAATHVSCSSSSKCTATSPAGEKAGAVAVRATVAGKHSRKARSAAEFTYE